LKFSLVGIAGQDISEGNPTLTLALVWQLMRAYTLSILTQLAAKDGSAHAVVESEIVEWVNKKVNNFNQSLFEHCFNILLFNTTISYKKLESHL
jgi:plastin-3